MRDPHFSKVGSQPISPIVSNAVQIRSTCLDLVLTIGLQSMHLFQNPFHDIHFTQCISIMQFESNNHDHSLFVMLKKFRLYLLLVIVLQQPVCVRKQCFDSPTHIRNAVLVRCNSVFMHPFIYLVNEYCFALMYFFAHTYFI